MRRANDAGKHDLTELTLDIVLSFLSLQLIGTEEF